MVKVLKRLSEYKRMKRGRKGYKEMKRRERGKREKKGGEKGSKGVKRVQKGSKRDPKRVRKCQNQQILPKRAQKGPEGVHKGCRFCHFGSLFIVKVVHLAKQI